MEICYHGNWKPSGLWVNHRESCLGRLRGRRLSAAENAGLGAKLQVGHLGHYIISESHSPAETFRDKTCKHKVVGFLFTNGSHRDNCVNVFRRHSDVGSWLYSARASAFTFILQNTPHPYLQYHRWGVSTACSLTPSPPNIRNTSFKRTCLMFSWFLFCYLKPFFPMKGYLSKPGRPAHLLFFLFIYHPHCWYSLNTISACNTFITHSAWCHN